MLELCPCASTLHILLIVDLRYRLGPQTPTHTRCAFPHTQQPIVPIYWKYFRIFPQEIRPSRTVGKRMSNCVAVKPAIAIAATWLIRFVQGVAGMYVLASKIIQFDYCGYVGVPHAWQYMLAKSKLSWNQQRIVGENTCQYCQSNLLRFMWHLAQLPVNCYCCQLEDNFDPAPPSPGANSSPGWRDGSMGSYPGATGRSQENCDSCLG